MLTWDFLKQYDHKQKLYRKPEIEEKYMTHVQSLNGEVHEYIMNNIIKSNKYIIKQCNLKNLIVFMICLAKNPTPKNG